MGQFVLGVIGAIIVGIILLNIEYTTFVPRTIDATSKAEHKLRELKRQAEIEAEADALQAGINARRIEKENRAREAALQQEQERARQEQARSERQRQAEVARRERQRYVDEWRRTHGGCDPGTNRYCTFVQGQNVGCSCQ